MMTFKAGSEWHTANTAQGTSSRENWQYLRDIFVSQFALFKFLTISKMPNCQSLIIAECCHWQVAESEEWGLVGGL